MVRHWPLVWAALIVSALWVPLLSNSADETCAASSAANCEGAPSVADAGQQSHLYSAQANKWQHFKDQIQQAKAEYVECGESVDELACTPCHDPVIELDLAPFKDSGISSGMIEEAMTVYPRVIKYQIIDGRLFRSPDCMFPFRCRGIEHFLSELLADLPDMEFVLNTRDWPQVSTYLKKRLPLLSFSKTSEFLDIMYPAWTFWEGGPAIGLYPSGLGRWDKHIESLSRAATRLPWATKLPQGFFRGSRTSTERDPLVLLSRQRPDLVNAQYTKNQAWKSDKDTLGLPAAEEVSLEDHCMFKYLFNYRGVAASFRFKHLFLCNSLVLHVGDEWQEFFYPALRPWIHYIPVKNGATEDDLQDLLDFIRHHDTEMREIADRGAAFIRRHLKFTDIGCYWRRLLTSYAALLSYTVERDRTLIEIRSK